MKQINYTIAGFCGAVGVLNLLTGDPVTGGFVLFCAVLAYRIGGLDE